MSRAFTVTAFLARHMPPDIIPATTMTDQARDRDFFAKSAIYDLTFHFVSDIVENLAAYCDLDGLGFHAKS